MMITANVFIFFDRPKNMEVEQKISNDMRIAIATAHLSQTFQVLESHLGSKLTKGDINKAIGSLILMSTTYYRI